MSDFKLALDLLEQVEGTFSDDANDPGGVTVFGITQKYDPTWGGWPVANHLIALHAIKVLGKDDPVLQTWVAKFYKVIWDGLGVEVLGQAMANAVIGAYVNQGPRVIGWVQAACDEQGAGLVIDRHMGPKTLSACLACPNQQKLYSDFTDLRVLAYNATAKARPAEATDLPGWLNRVKQGA